jgi:hypothetical protein
MFYRVIIAVWLTMAIAASLIITSCSNQPVVHSPMPAPAPMQRFCQPGENPEINRCKDFSADQTSGGTSRGNHDEDFH